MESYEALEIVILVGQLAITLIAGSVIPWAMKVASRLTKLETLIGNGLCADVRAIKDHCPGCHGQLQVIAAKLDAVEQRLKEE